MKEKFARLIDTKSIITLSLTFTLIAVILTRINIEQTQFALFNNAFMLCLGFFFGKPKTTDDNK